MSTSVPLAQLADVSLMIQTAKLLVSIPKAATDVSAKWDTNLVLMAFVEVSPYLKCRTSQKELLVFEHFILRGILDRLE